MNRHLVSIKVRIESFTNERMHEDRVSFDENRLERLDPHPVQGRRTVQQHRVPLSHLFKDVPDLIVLALKHLLCALDGVCVSQLLQTTDDEGLEQLESDLLG